MNNTPQYSIGLFDSGVGGLSVFHTLEKAFPEESFLYFADTVHFPYGNKSPADIFRFSINNCAALIAEGAKTVLIACHTASCYSEQLVNEFFPTPIIGIIQLTIEKALQMTRSKKIAIFATQATVDSKIYQKLIHKTAPETILFPVACPKLASQVESNRIHSLQTREFIREYLQQIKGKNIDTLILGSTHYSFLTEIFREECGSSITLIDAAHCILPVIRDRIKHQTHSRPKHKFFVSGDREKFLEFLQEFPPIGNFEVQLFPQHV